MSLRMSARATIVWPIVTEWNGRGLEVGNGREYVTEGSILVAVLEGQT
jgi:hypothetical protein